MSLVPSCVLLLYADLKLTGSDLADQPALPVGVTFCDTCEYDPECCFLLPLAVSSPPSLWLCPLLVPFSGGRLPVCSHTLHQQLDGSLQAVTCVHPLCCGTLRSATPRQTRPPALRADARRCTDHKQNGSHDGEGHPGKSSGLL